MRHSFTTFGCLLRVSTVALLQYPTIHTLAEHLTQANSEASTVKYQERSSRLGNQSSVHQQRQLRQNHRNKKNSEY
jgi:hypothetical protein